MFATEIFYNTWKPVPITHTKDSLEISLQFTQGDTYIISIVEGGFASTVKYKWKGTLTSVITISGNPYSIHCIISSNIIISHCMQIIGYLQPYFLW